MAEVIESFELTSMMIVYNFIKKKFNHEDCSGFKIRYVSCVNRDV